MVKGFFVAALAGHGVVDVRQRHHLRGNGDLLALQPVGVAAPVPALVVPAADLVADLDQRLLLLEGQVFQNMRTDGGVRFHNVKFFFGQASGLVEDLLRDVDLADIMQRGRRADHGDIRRRQLVFVGFFHQMVQNQLGGGVDMQNVRAAFAVAEFNDVAQDIDHQVVAFLVFVHLPCHQPHQLLLLGVKHQRVGDAAAHDGHIERAADKIRCA